ncbi:TPA: class I SAM-dependent methyltransferase [Burkholderia cenocepacia]|uniref:methyltransferase domain-containing protein n=1 Tax=unclassified Burkholderia TaxID=2613784 RepID=UPI0015885E6D|nr:MULTISPECIES: class I SAM-dependent methyltransferase [unclassified Burkholderia]HEF5874767.1 class I SAM-dependent methyltransferase [Burkholderia cenocepacia]
MVETIQIHPNDDMFHGSTEHYHSVGEQLSDLACEAAVLSGAPSPQVLELPCGYGRVTRQLVKHFAPESILVADIMVPAVDYCVSTFGVRGAYVTDPVYEFANIEPHCFDVALLGSLVTHLSQINARTVMRNFFAKLRTGGVAVVTTHGERSRELLGAGDCYQVGDEAREHLIGSYDAGNYGFVNYRDDHSLEAKTVDYIGNSYGIAMIPTSWVHDVCRENDLTIIEHRPGGWDNHQDVFLIKR